MTGVYHCKRGSEWRKWDLHVHSRASALANEFEGATIEEKWSNYFAKLKSLTDLKVIGITDYFSIEGYQKTIAEGDLTNFDLILPNVELRILPVTGSDTPINIHIIFDPLIVDDLDSKFFSNLEYTYSGDTYKCTRADLIHELDSIWQADGYDQFDLDDGVINGVFLPQKLHPGGHVGGYYSAVANNLTTYISQQSRTRQQVINRISEIRNDMLGNRNTVYKTNNSWNEPDAVQYLDAIANTKSAYGN